MSKKLWGGRFTKKTNPLVEEFTKSIHYDYKLAEHDIEGSMAHVEILRRAGYLTSGEAAKLKEGLSGILVMFKKGRFKLSPNVEDIHTQIQNALHEKVGDLTLKLHTARSRNDQVAFATKLYCKAALNQLNGAIEGLIASFGKLASKNKDIIVPGFTHMQHAQPVWLKDCAGAYIEMLKRDKSRLAGISKGIMVTMGAGALAGTPIDSSKYGAYATVNSLDAVSDRDFVLEILSALAILAMHLSRVSEDLIIWSTQEFGFVDIDESFCTGSSLMPQKKNPDTLELIRGYTGRFYGNLVSALAMMKGLPLSYNRDMQLDKEPLFNSVEIALYELKIMSGLIGTLKFNKDNIGKHLEDESLYATDLIYYLVSLGVPFAKAHELIGGLVKYSLKNCSPIKDMQEGLLKKLLSGKVKKSEIVKRLDPAFSVKSKRSVTRKG